MRQHIQIQMIIGSTMTKKTLTDIATTIVAKILASIYGKDFTLLHNTTQMYIHIHIAGMYTLASVSYQYDVNLSGHNSFMHTGLLR